MKTDFVPLTSIRDLAEIFNISAKEIFKYSNFSEKYYKIKNIPKRKGGVRVIVIPCDELKKIQRWILREILYKNNIDEVAHGFIKNRSIVTNAQIHLNAKIVYNLDLKDFFPSIKFLNVYNVFKKMGYNRNVCTLLSNLCTYEGYLPQGAPTSPYLSNLVLKRMDMRLKCYSEKKKLKYSRYADDLTFSGERLSKNTKYFIKKIILSEGFEINLKKERVALKSTRQEVTGLIVNGKRLSLPREKERYLRQQIFYCKTKGVFDNLLFQNKEEVSNYSAHLYGLAHYINMVDPNKGRKYLEELDKIDWES